jgi:hypothetical protein
MSLPLRLASIRLDLASDSLNEGPHVIVLVTVLSTPHSLKDLSVQQDLPSVRGGIGKHVELR